MNQSDRSKTRTIHLPRVLSDDYSISRSEARRLIAQGGVLLNGEVCRDLDYEYPADDPCDVRIALRKRDFSGSDDV